ncbi:iron ABC transporter permease [Alphaproteobacteria bacterium GH1-50]|uniref:Iron ABC transporter permease n=1 Tax=Kangsaoukella pontilimi TaxID=2691042 RepID=A0A7C9MYI0_9RHOB|nr:lipocalin-like domain-containing protein [Kangsaoukella pontilimi]MXQ06798.1 iron ABC transporter permease [Kangsaoukella pontilimi]
MNARVYAHILSVIGVLLTVPGTVLAQGFAGLGSSAVGFDLPDPDTRFTFPEDHGAHPEFRIEWWYLTANLTGADGEDYGIQWTLFRNAIAPGGAPEDQVWMAHAAVSAPDMHLTAERFARGGLGQAGVTATPFEAWLDEWRMAGPSLADVDLTAQGSDWAYDLTFSATGPFVPQGQNGYSVKSEEGLASQYYSQPFYEVTGTLTLPSGAVDVSGQGWLDREWSSQPLAPDQTGWDWVSLHLDGGAKLMGYRLRRADGTDYTVGTWITADGAPTPLNDGEITMTDERRAIVAGRDVPVAWAVAVPSHGVDIRAEALGDQSWMEAAVPYWEGPVTVEGSHSGRGYLEMTGYE